MAPGDIGTNTPIDFLLQGFDVVLYSLYIVPGQPTPDPLPDCDIAIVTVSESDQNRPIIQEIERLMPSLPCRTLNRPDRVLRLSRENMHFALGDIQDLAMPATARVDRAVLRELGLGSIQIEQLFEDATFPLIVRPIGSHAGKGLAKLDLPSAVGPYLTEYQDAEFFISSYVDYRSRDGLFRKYRVIWVDGRPYPCHMAIADDWRVWYQNADMSMSAIKRAEEAHFMATFDDAFARRHAGSLAATAGHFGLEYMGIDCAELPDGSLLVFEGDIAMVAHDMDRPDLYSYKGPQMRKLFSAFRDMLKRKSLMSAVPVGFDCE